MLKDDSLKKRPKTSTTRSRSNVKLHKTMVDRYRASEENKYGIKLNEYLATRMQHLEHRYSEKADA